jgi:chromosome transmission fidelity protein 1
MTSMTDPSMANFCHPYQPYDIQLQFMTELYQCIEKGQVGIFESPTGTGKSLSLICGALTWLRDHKRRSLDIAVQISHLSEDMPQWMSDAEQKERRQQLLRQRKELEAKLASARKEEARRQTRTARGPHVKRRRLSEDKKSLESGDDDTQYMLADYESDDNRQTNLAASSGYSTNTQALLDKLKGVSSTAEEDSELNETKIIFCSRTHSQLTQFVNEIRKVKPPPSILFDDDSHEQIVADEEVIKHLSLGSRKNLCINAKVSVLQSAAAINERCLELQKPGTAKDHKCSFLPGKDSKDALETFRIRALAHIQDIEDLGKLGKTLEICPYYAARSAIAASEIVTLPYPLLLQKSAREALGISLKDNVVVIDEAHNLIDAIAGLFSISLRLQDVVTAEAQVTTYVQKFVSKLKGKNRMYVTQVLRLLKSIKECLGGFSPNGKQSEHAVAASQIMAGKGCDQIRPHKLIQYLQESKLAHKVEGYIDAKQDPKQSRPKGILMQLQNFLIVLMNPASEGRFFVTVEREDTSVRYALLDPREHFRDIVEEARAVILAGGTMSPLSDYTDYLFSYLAPDRLVNFSFGHVIPATNMLTKAVTRGPSAKELLYNYENRASDGVVMELRLLLERLCSIVPDGVVVFFPSYDYLAQVVKTWTRVSDGTLGLGKHKPVFSETRTAGVDDLLNAYTSAIDKGTGAILLAVVGGKLSEGINFSDKLGRAVVAVGLPFPNANGAEWKAKIQHVEQTKHASAIASGGSERDAKALGVAAGRDFYENACMRAVNQCIGRAIRHKNDYAAILLVDSRFATERIEKKLPGWIRDGMERQAPKEWSAMETGLKTFFEGKV